MEVRAGVGDEAMSSVSLQALMLQGGVHASHGELASALHFFERARALAEAAGDQQALSEVLGALGEAHHEQGDIEAAIAAFKEALRLDQAHDDQAGAAGMQRRLGAAFQEKGDLDRATDAYRDCERLLEGLASTPAAQRELIRLLIAQSSLHAEQGQYHAAHERLKTALSASRATHTEAAEIECLRRLGAVSQELGDLPAAHDHVARARELIEKHSDETRDLPELIEVLLLQGVIYQDDGKTKQALERFREALRLAESLRLAPARANCLGRLGSAHKARGEFAQAIDRYQQAVSISRDLRDEVMLSHLYGELGDVYSRRVANNAVTVRNARAVP